MGRRSDVFYRRLQAVLLGALCAAALAACGGSSGGQTSAQYANGLCTAIGSWQSRLQEGSAILAQRMNAAGTLKKVRTELVTFFTSALRETDTMLADVRAVEPPDIDDGEAIAADILQGLERFRPILVDARAKAGKLPLDDELAFTTGAQTVGKDFQEAADAIGDLLSDLETKYDVPELDEAFTEDPACMSL